MSSQPNLKSLSVGEFAQQIHHELVPLSNRFSYFFTALPLGEDDIKEYLEEPVAALPPGLCAELPAASILLVPYLEKGDKSNEGDEPPQDLICFEKPADHRMIWSSKFVSSGEVALVFALKDQHVGDYHYRFYYLLAELARETCGVETLEQFYGILRDELSNGVHGEVDEQSWHLKQALLRRQRNLRRKTKGFSMYARQSFADTLTLYLHGICCDIDVETGPRMLTGRHLRRRLELLQSLYPPPDGYAVFPEDLNGK